ncbi:PH and SEC7 domain-containing protein-like isoform X3 [Aethina tumida]|uniref:PH and SEC7 domain-containing protein-like isoform X3 n=1 Tax=Aethina tumida TaxID=116153 RepID=UPI0021496C2E|nr:PH and SEC7 domain-containing protein-like isoform X3 [Aethina tumida]
MADELSVVLNRNENSGSGFGFSLLRKPGVPPIIYDISHDSPAAASGKVEVGDIILKVNEIDVNLFNTKEVLKCLRLSSDPVTLKIKRDPKNKETVQRHLLSATGVDAPGANCGNAAPLAAVHGTKSNREPESASDDSGDKVNANRRHAAQANGSCAEREPLLADDQNDFQTKAENERLQWQPLGSDVGDKSNQPKCEAYMMTGEHILKISNTTQTQKIIPKKQKKVENLRYHNSHTHHLRHQPQVTQYNSNSVPNSPNEMELGHHRSASATAATGNHCASAASSAASSPVNANRKDYSQQQQQQQQHTPTDLYTHGGYVRNSRSEDQLQATIDQDRCLPGGAVHTVADCDEDVASSLNTLLDTRPESAGSGSSGAKDPNGDRIVWTYNAPLADQHRFQHALSNGSSSSHSNTSPTSSSPLHSGSPASPTSVSSSVMSSQSGSRRLPLPLSNGPHSSGNAHHDYSEAISNISSPDYHEEDSSVGIRDCVMEISDHSDSDSTLLVSEPRQRPQQQQQQQGNDHRIVIQVKGPEKDRGRADVYGYQVSEIHHYVDSYGGECDQGELGDVSGYRQERTSSSPQSSEDESDVDSLHSFQYSPKAVDIPSAIRLAKRLYSLDGFKKSDVSRHLSKNNDFSRAVAEEYVKYFEFQDDTVDIALRKFLKQFSLTGETQERERVLIHFSKRYLDCNPGSFNSQDAVHTLTCAIMLLNTDLHGQNISRKMTISEFIDNLVGLNEGENFPRDVLKALYQAIKNYPLEWALDEETDDGRLQSEMTNYETVNIGGNPFLNIPMQANAIDYKKGYVMRKCCYEANAKRSLCCIFLAPFHKRSWKMFYCTLRDLVLYLHKDENGFRKNQMGDSLHNAIRIHHALATKANDYTKKQYVFRVQTADQAEYLFQTSDSKELQSWIDNINFVCASYSAPPLEAAVGSQKKFQRPLLPCSHTKLNLREQLADHEERVCRLEATLEEHRKSPPEKGTKSLIVQNYKEKEAYLTYEIKRYKTYSYMLRSKISQLPEFGVSLAENSIGEAEEQSLGASSVTLIEGPASGGIVPPPIPDRQTPPTNRYSYRQAIYSRNAAAEGGADADIG